MKPNDLYKAKKSDASALTNIPRLVQVIKTYNKPIIDPMCPESVEIATMVSYVSMSGPSIGQNRTIRLRAFRFNYEKLEPIAEV